MLVLLRIIFGGAFLWVIKEGIAFSAANPESGDLTTAGYVALSVIIAIANAVVWAPYIGAKVAEPLTGTMIRSTYVERTNGLLKFLLWAQERRRRRLVLFLCFLEGIHHPERPVAFVIGLKHARPGSWLEKVYAREVYRFDNAQNCIEAYKTLKRRGIDPRRHHNPEVNMVMMSLDRAAKPDPEKLVVPVFAGPPPLKRNRRIRLFKSAPNESADTQSAVGVNQEHVMETTAAISDQFGTIEAPETLVAEESDTVPTDAPRPAWNILSRLREIYREAWHHRTK